MHAKSLPWRSIRPVSRFPFIRVVFGAFAVSAIAACSTTPPESATPAMAKSIADGHSGHASVGNGPLTPAQFEAIAEVRKALAGFHDFAASQRAGYTNQYPAGCAQSADGAQAYHYLNDKLVDANVELLKPELLMYEPQPNGSLQLIGVDYVVPFDKWTAPEPPTLLGVPFGRNEPLGVWALHIWAWRPNPSGMFAPWNPKVSCQYAR